MPLKATMAKPTTIQYPKSEAANNSQRWKTEIWIWMKIASSSKNPKAYAANHSDDGEKLKHWNQDNLFTRQGYNKTNLLKSQQE